MTTERKEWRWRRQAVNYVVKHGGSWTQKSIMQDALRVAYRYGCGVGTDADLQLARGKALAEIKRLEACALNACGKMQMEEVTQYFADCRIPELAAALCDPLVDGMTKAGARDWAFKIQSLVSYSDYSVERKVKSAA